MNPKAPEEIPVKASYLSSGVRMDQLPAPDRPEFALIGRSNVGKSSLINRLAQHQGLAKSSASPGKTRLINHFLFEMPAAMSIYVVDLPGYGYARASKKDIEAWNLMMKRYLRERPNLVCVLQLIDSRLSPQKADLDFANQMGEWGLPLVLVFTKTDKDSMVQATRNADRYGKAMLESWESLPPTFMSSATNGRGRNEILKFLMDCSKQWVRQG
jgi:GTP-binding protein